MRPDAGSVEINGTTDYSSLRTRVALIDAPEVSEPAADLTVAQVVAEELMFSGRIGHRRAVGRVLSGLGMTADRRTAIGNLEPAARIRLLSELAVLRDGVQGLVMTSPDRHGGDPHDWWAVALDLASRGYAVLVIAGEASARALGEGGHSVDDADMKTVGAAA
jgi:hypothetical protein